jgi:hypothetical protein
MPVKTFEALEHRKLMDQYNEWEQEVVKLMADHKIPGPGGVLTNVPLQSAAVFSTCVFDGYMFYTLVVFHNCPWWKEAEDFFEPTPLISLHKNE